MGNAAPARRTVLQAANEAITLANDCLDELKAVRSSAALDRSTNKSRVDELARSADRRYVGLDQRVAPLEASLKQLRALTFLGRLRWLFTGDLVVREVE
jgi:hypothetical protein